MKKTQLARKPVIYHPDVLVFLLAIPLINAFNFYLTYSNIKLNSFFFTRFVIDLLQGYAAWWIVRWMIIQLDEKMPYSENPSKRITTQIFSTTLVGLLFIALTTEILSLLVKNEFAPLDFYTKDLFIISVWFLVINGYYIGMYFFREWQKSISSSKTLDVKPLGILVKKGNKSLLIHFEEILYFVVDGDYVQLMDNSKQRYLMDLSLDKIEKKVSPSDFFRINRQVLIHRQVIKGFRRIENGKLMVELDKEEDPLPDLTISRTKAPSFRAWFLPYA
ncbi:LytTR family transcriptional regulator [Cyclobacteriaceae bacterium YHN15]|nr:LytTR family transcriptional regulator [Cyclobacteriaceae bacterium YHN15]